MDGGKITQALAAAGRTVPGQFVAHSLHSYFLYPGDDRVSIIYSVHRVRENAKRFMTRNVIGHQRGRAIFTVSISFQSPETGFEHQDDMPSVPPPDNLLSIPDLYLVSFVFGCSSRSKRSLANHLAS